jgi:iron complex outermembrane receptor protein
MIKHVMSRLLCTAISLASPAIVQAQAASTLSSEGADTGADDNQEIVVTAQKREERLSDVPISITAFTGDQLSRQGVSNPAELAKVVPGFTYQNSAYGVPVFTIRGIGLFDNSIGISPTVSVYVDQVPLPYLAMTAGAGLDVARVEVLKGPQGTLFGQNATGGAINYVAAKPTKDYEAGLDLTLGRFDTFNAQGYVSGPITDTLGFRVSVNNENRGDWQRSETRPEDTLGRRRFTAGRLLLDWEPTDRFKLSFNANGWLDKSDTLASQFIGFRLTLPPPRGYPEVAAAIGNRPFAPNNPRIADWDPGIDFGRDDWLYQFAAQADWQISDLVTLTSITALTEFSTFALTDSDGTDYNNFRRAIDGQIKSFSQELRIVADLDAVNLTTGINYQDDKTQERNPTNYRGSNSGVGPFRYFTFDNVTNQQAKTYAVFATVDSALTDTLTAQLGSRYTKQNRDYQGCLRDTGDGALAAAIGFIPVIAGGAFNPVAPGQCVTLTNAFQPAGLVTDELDQDNVSWRAGLNWKPSEDLLFYGNVTRGFKAGSFTPLPAVYASQLTPVTQERVTAFETGVKASVLDRLMSLTASVFYYDYKDKQILGSGNVPIFGTLPQLQNVPQSEVRGAEIDITLRPFDGLRLRAGGTYIKSRVTRSYLTPDPLGRVVDVEGEAFPNTPKFQAALDGEYSFRLGEMAAYLGGNLVYRSASNAAFGENQTFRLRPYTVVDLRAGFGAANEVWQVEVWGRNVFNSFYWTNVNYAVDAISRAPGMPATYGATLRLRY